MVFTQQPESFQTDQAQISYVLGLFFTVMRKISSLLSAPADKKKRKKRVHTQLEQHRLFSWMYSKWRLCCEKLFPQKGQTCKVQVYTVKPWNHYYAQTCKFKFLYVKIASLSLSKHSLTQAQKQIFWILKWARQTCISLVPLEYNVPVCALNGKRLTNITHQTVPLTLLLSGNHQEVITFKLFNSKRDGGTRVSCGCNGS